MAQIKINVPFLDEATVKSLKAGDQILLSGTMYTARDAAHKRMAEQIEIGEELPFELKNQVIYYVGPTPAKPGEVIGSAGPTTSSRMDKFTATLLERGLKGMIGKGYRGQEVIDSIANNNAVYCAAIGGSGALLAKKIKSVESVAYQDLGTEAIRKIQIEDFPCMVINDSKGRDWYKESQEKYKKL
ncbi:fumarate hydratase subunit beta [Lentibacillus halodurans]|uniref:Fumarate hydratase subunit beta n=1 Tax=Lentibacillus halodurans TaxID=237679 RepID=A0A1I0XPX1_9BACI|nr:Fe-S-containing hydro-lyase [Lentibacillus halodurans]SFB02737.1 fumarate hydratase subunit beta [Lentibacillus halodurans]